MQLPPETYALYAIATWYHITQIQILLVTMVIQGMVLAGESWDKLGEVIIVFAPKLTGHPESLKLPGGGGNSPLTLPLCNILSIIQILKLTPQYIVNFKS